jgi:hypothetical protein
MKAALEKQSRWHKLHICGSSAAVLMFFRQISPGRILHREPRSFRGYDLAELYWEVTRYFRGTI